MVEATRARTRCISLVRVLVQRGVVLVVEDVSLDAVTRVITCDVNNIIFFVYSTMSHDMGRCQTCFQQDPTNVIGAKVAKVTTLLLCHSCT
jgi:hypothetical protein